MPGCKISEHTLDDQLGCRDLKKSRQWPLQLYDIFIYYPDSTMMLYSGDVSVLQSPIVKSLDVTCVNTIVFRHIKDLCSAIYDEPFATCNETVGKHQSFTLHCILFGVWRVIDCWLALLILPVWCFVTRKAIATMLITQPYASSCLPFICLKRIACDYHKNYNYAHF